MITKRELKEQIRLLYEELGYTFSWFHSAGGLISHDFTNGNQKKNPVSKNVFDEYIARLVKRIYTLEEKNKAIEEYLGIEFTENNTKGYYKIKK